MDVGAYITDRSTKLCKESGQPMPVVVDMGCGDGWLLRELTQRGTPHQYIGLDLSERFLEYCRARYASTGAHFWSADFETPMDTAFDADLVVNAFNLFELCDLVQAFSNASRFLKPGGTFLVATIDKTFLILAVSDGWGDFLGNLRRYAELPGVKYAFQPIDLGSAVSDTLYYPSVFYSTEDYLDAAARSGLQLSSYREIAFTHAVVPKIYCFLEFTKDDVDPGAGDV